MARQDPLTDNPEQNTYRQESILFQLIKLGDLPSLEKQLKSARFPMVSGTYATTPLRQAKNLFIVTVTKAGMLGAIPGGGDVEKVYQLINMYIRECEQLQNIDAVYALMFSMLQGFCRITGESKLPEELSADMYAGVNFIRAHTNEPIGVEDVARHIGRSESYLASHFRQELGTSVGAYITECKLEKARSLLRHSDRTLAEISAYLCFSSQSYFQNVFKKQFGVTPTQYRRKHRGL
jgi:AraC-like DNA-binding protein